MWMVSQRFQAATSRRVVLRPEACFPKEDSWATSQPYATA